VNKYVDENEVPHEDFLKVDPQTEVDQVARLKSFKASRDQADLQAKLDAMLETARGDGNILHPMREALKAGASIGEVCGVLRDEWGEYKEDL
jgi:methylmalonyl-CoA mutase N-terminal domain/subunit